MKQKFQKGVRIFSAKTKQINKTVMTEEEFYDWMEGLDTPQTFTDDLKQDIIDNVDNLINQLKQT